MDFIAAVLCMTIVSVGLQRSASFPDSFVDRSSQNLSSVPNDLPPTAVSVDLSCNHIHQLLKGGFRNTPLLTFLNMSGNSLEVIDQETFLDTPLLENLDLSHNNLKNLSRQTYLLGAVNLLMLNLTWNKFPTMTLGTEFSGLVNLRSFAVGAQNISVGDFKNVAKVKLQMLGLSLEDKLGYESGSLEDVHAHRLQVAFSSLQTIDHDLMAEALQLFVEVELMNLTSGFKSLSELLKQRGEMLTQHFYLNDIIINWTDLTQFVNAALSASIAHFSLSDVVLMHLPLSGTKVARTSQMKSFKVRRATVKDFIFNQEAVYSFFINLPLKSLAITETPLIHMTCPQYPSPVLNLDFSHCTISDTIFSRVEGQHTVECENLANVRILTLLNNNFKNLQVLTQRFQYMMSLQHLDLSLNLIVYDGEPECFWPPSINVLNLSSNRLADSVFHCLPKGLATLDLQNNQILSVPSSVYTLKNLSSLNLNANRLLDLPVCDTFPGLKELLLKSNALHAPVVSRLANCTKLQTLDVSHNPFTCICSLRGFISLGITSEGERRPAGIKILNWPLGYNCIYPEALRDSSLRDFWVPEISCNTWLLAATILVPAVVLIVTTVVMCNRFDVPWYIGMIWQWTRAKHRARKRQVATENLLGVEFHAFVSYSQHDADWVHNSLFPNLEGSSGGLRISHHEQNFVPGKTIIENIMACVEKSRRSVFVLSAHFVKSEWCHYELYFASHQQLSRGSDSIVLVLLEPLPQYLIPSKYFQLKSMMSRHTYLEWPQDRVKQRLFWANLRAALQADLPHAPQTEIQG